MDRQQLITKVLERDGDRLQALRDRFRSEVSDASYRAMAEILRDWILASGSVGPAPELLDALAVHLVGTLVNIRRSNWTLGGPPLALADTLLLDSWVRLCQATLTAASNDSGET